MKIVASKGHPFKPRKKRPEKPLSVRSRTSFTGAARPAGAFSVVGGIGTPEQPQTRCASPTDHGLASVTSAKITVFVDTLVIFYRRLPAGLLKQATVMLGPSPTPRVMRDKLEWGSRVIIHQPTKQLLEYLDNHDGVVSRVDIAYDFCARGHADVDLIADYLRKNVMLKHQRPGHWMRDKENTTYWRYKPKSQKPAPRNLALYSDRPSKLLKYATGFNHRKRVAHLELRLHSAETIRRNEIRKPSDLLTINPKVIFDRNVGIVDFSHHVENDSKGNDRIRAHYARYGMDRLQNYRNSRVSIRNLRVKTLNDELPIPDAMMVLV